MIQVMLDHTVEHNFPDAVGIGKRPRCSLFGRDVCQQLSHGRTLPGIARKRSAQLIFDTLDVGHTPSCSMALIRLAPEGKKKA
jgi:hypothetical protein